MSCLRLSNGFFRKFTMFKEISNFFFTNCFVFKKCFSN